MKQGPLIQGALVEGDKPLPASTAVRPDDFIIFSDLAIHNYEDLPNCLKNVPK